MFVSRSSVFRNEAESGPQTVPVDLTMRCQTVFGILITGAIQLTATNNSDYDAYVRVNWKWVNQSAAHNLEWSINRLMSMLAAFDQVYHVSSQSLTPGTQCILLCQRMKRSEGNGPTKSWFHWDEESHVTFRQVVLTIVCSIGARWQTLLLFDFYE